MYQNYEKYPMRCKVSAFVIVIQVQKKKKDGG